MIIQALQVDCKQHFEIAFDPQTLWYSSVLDVLCEKITVANDAQHFDTHSTEDRC